jgi:hypothetical protein
MAYPGLFYIGGIVLMIQYFADKLLITYYYKENVEQNDLLNRTALVIIKYGCCIYFIFGGLGIALNHCSITS